MRHIYTKEEDTFLINNVRGLTDLELTNKFNKYFNLSLSIKSIKMRKHRLNLFNENKKGKRGFVPNRHKYPKGNKPWNSEPIGTEKWIHGYLYVKVKDGADKRNWKEKHRILWEEKYGTIPKGYVIMFKDGNKNNISIDNLALLSKEEMFILSTNKLIFNEKELTESGINISRLIAKVNNLRR